MATTAESTSVQFPMVTEYTIIPVEFKITSDFRSRFVMIHFTMFIVYLLTKNSFFYTSYYSDRPIFFYGLLTVYMVMIKYYTKACGSPGYADDIENIESEEEIDKNRFFCKRCKLYAPVRASHCASCGKCIIRRDHHCPWTGNCIGRDNHLYFFIFTFLESFSQSIPDCDSIYHFLTYIFIVKDHKNFLLTILPYVILIGFSSFGVFISFSLTFRNFQGLLNNLTTWERARISHITYMKNLPPGYSPFNKGIIGNFIEFCTMKKNKTKWKINAPDAHIFDDDAIKVTIPAQILFK